MIGHVVWVIEPVGRAWNVPTSPVMAPSVQVTAWLASTVKLDELPLGFPSPAQPSRRSAERVGPVRPDGPDRPVESVLQAVNNAANAATTATRAISRGGPNMGSSWRWCEHRRARGSMSMSDLARLHGKTCQRLTPANIRRQDEKRLSNSGRALEPGGARGASSLGARSRGRTAAAGGRTGPLDQ